MLPDTKEYGDRIERMLRLSLNIDLDAKVSWVAYNLQMIIDLNICFLR